MCVTGTVVLVVQYGCFVCWLVLNYQFIKTKKKYYSYIYIQTGEKSSIWSIRS